MKIALGCDHGGYELKQFVMKILMLPLPRFLFMETAFTQVVQKIR